jgi:Holliday junction resolvase
VKKGSVQKMRLWGRATKKTINQAKTIEKVKLSFILPLLLMNRKAKGSNAERELVKMFWDSGWAAIRVAGSGSARFPNPDVLAGNRIRRVAVECKTVHDSKKYLSGADISQIKEFSEKFGAEPWIAVRFDSQQWYFMGIEEIAGTKDSNFVVSLELARHSGLLFSEFIGNFSEKSRGKE